MYPKGKQGRPPYALVNMLRIHFMQQWFGLSDLAMEESWTSLFEQQDENRDFHPFWMVGMRKSKFTESQIVAILAEGDAGLPVAEVCRKHGISNALYYQWKSKYAGVSVNELKRVRELEAENSRLKKMYAELALENTAIKDVLSRKL